MATQPQTPPPQSNNEPGTHLPPATPPATDPERERLAGDLARSRAENARLTALIRSGQAAPPTVVQQGAPPAAPQPDLKDLNRRFLQDPMQTATAVAQSVVQQTVPQQISAAVAPHMEALVTVAKDAARREDPETWDRFAAEVELEVTQNTPQQYWTNPNIWKHGFNVVKGKHYNELKNVPPAAAPAVHISSSGGPGAPSTRTAPATPGHAALSADEKEVARGFGLTDDQYASAKAKLENMDPRGRVNKPSPFDGLITFSSKQKRKEQRDEQRRRQGK